ncbi:MAG: AMP-dependent synthetase [Alphaproteobacteria bacterium]|nr:MAG: AMP-dependent synthetase [Alphaproteobacteria bacterium]
MSRRLFSKAGQWDELRRTFRWNVPDRFNMADALCDSWARREPEREALRHLHPDGTAEVWTYRRLAEASTRFAHVLAASGVGKGDRVGVLLPQGPAVLVADLAAWRLGAVALPLFTLFGAEALGYRLRDSGARVVVTDDENLDKVMALRPDLPMLRSVLTTGPARSGAAALWDEIERASAAPVRADTRAEDPAVLIYTSGTTGPPKGVLHAHRFLVGHLPSIELQHDFFPQRGDRGWTPADWAWIGGLMDMAVPCLYYGVPLVSRRFRKFDPEAAWDLIAREGVRNLFLPPTALKLMRSVPVPEGVSVRSIASGGESLGAELLEWGRSALGVAINEIYGQTECNLVIGTSARAMDVRPGAMGKAVPGHDVAIIDEGGRPLPAGEVGEIAVRRGDPVMFLEYWQKPEATAQKFLGDWMRTGDLGRVDEDGYFTFVARADDVITSAGYRIGPTEIEECLAGDPDVVMAAAVGVPDPVRTEVVHAFVVLREGAAWSEALEARLIARVRARVSPHVAPRRITPLPGLPMTATGKIMRRALREGATAGQAGDARPRTVSPTRRPIRR